MRYLIKAHFIEEKKEEFLKKLNVVARQKPDGLEILESMQRARITAPGVIEWCATCFCDSPLNHERETVYDEYFTDIHTQEINSDPEINGNSFWEHLQG